MVAGWSPCRIRPPDQAGCRSTATSTPRCNADQFRPWPPSSTTYRPSKTAFHSVSFQNIGSLKLAQKLKLRLGLVCLADDTAGSFRFFLDVTGPDLGHDPSYRFASESASLANNPPRGRPTRQFPVTPSTVHNER